MKIAIIGAGYGGMAAAYDLKKAGHDVTALVRDNEKARRVGKRGGHPVVIEVLRQLGVLDDEALTALKNYRTWKITNHRGTEVGEVRASFNLRYAM